jgi:hypothetical protein
MASEERRTCPIFRIERGTFQECHTRTLNYDCPSLNEDEDICLRVTKFPSANSSPLPSNKIFSNNGKNVLVNSSTNNVIHRESWDDTGRSLNDTSTDDYVFL